jgi:hypothetical protein
MLNLERILNPDRLMRAMTRSNRKAFEALLPSFVAAYQQSLTRKELRAYSLQHQDDEDAIQRQVSF